MNTPPPEITDPLLKSLVEETLHLPRMAALEARKIRERKRAPLPAFRRFRPLPGIVWLLQFRATQAALALLLLAAMVEGGSLLTGERSHLRNPVTGKVAFWTDDASSKVNVNRTSDGTYWDTPVTNPDHPAPPILGDSNYHNLTGTNWASFASYINQLSPRFSGDTSDTRVISGTLSDGDFSSRAGTWRPTQYLRNDNLAFASGTVNSPVMYDSLPTGNIGKIQYSGGNTISAPIVLGGNQTWAFNAAPSSPLIVSGTINGSSSLNKSGSGSPDLIGGITVDKSVALNGGSLINSSAGSTSVLDNGVSSVKIGVANGSSTFSGTITNAFGQLHVDSGTTSTVNVWDGKNARVDALIGSGTIARYGYSTASAGDWDNGINWTTQTNQGQVVPLPAISGSHPWQTHLYRPALKLAAREPNAGASSGGDPAQPVATPPLVDARKLIRNAALDFEVASFESALDTVGKVAGEEQGYILTQNSEKGANGKLQGAIIVKVLPGNLDRFLLKLRALGDMKNQTVSGNDVTKDYYDTAARIRNSQVTEARLVEMMKTRTGKVSDLLEVENEIAKVRGEIEQMQGQLKYYDGLVQYATVTITLREKDINQAAAYLLQEHAQLSLFAKDVEAAFAEAKTDAANAKAQTLDSHIERNESGQEVATLHLLLPPENSDEAVMKLKAIGRIQNFNSQTQRVSRDGGSAPSDTAKIDRDKVEISILIQRDAGNPVQGTNIGVQTDQVEEKTAQIKQAAAAAGVEVKGAEFNRAQNGVEVSAMLLRMPVKKYAAFLEQIKSLGKVKNFTVARREDATATEDAPAEIALQIFSQGSIVAPETGLWVTIRHTLGEGMGALMWSVRMIGVSLAWIAPWAVVAGLAGWVIARRRRRRAAKKQG